MEYLGMYVCNLVLEGCGENSKHIFHGTRYFPGLSGGGKKNNEIISGYPTDSTPAEIQTGNLSNQIRVRNINTQANLLSTYMAKSFSYFHMDSYVI
jgi:hypothetical protein